MTDKKFLKDFKIESSEASEELWQEWRNDDIVRYEDRIEGLKKDWYQLASEYGNMENLKNIWRLVAVTAIGLLMIAIIFPRPR